MSLLPSVLISFAQWVWLTNKSIAIQSLNHIKRSLQTSASLKGLPIRQPFLFNKKCHFTLALVCNERLTWAYVCNVSKLKFYCDKAPLQ